MVRIYLMAFVITFPSFQLFSQLRFPVEKGYIRFHNVHHPWEDIIMDGDNDSVYACESGRIINVFEVEGDKYILMKGKYFISYGPFTLVNVKRLDSVEQGKVLGNVAFDKERSKCLEINIMETAEKNLCLKDVFPGYAWEEVKSKPIK